MEAIGFLRQTVVNPNTGEESERLAVKFDNARVIKLYLKGEELDKVQADIKADRDKALKSITVKDGEFGPFAVLSAAVITEEF